MASYSPLYPIALHVLPLHALKGVLERRALLSKGQHALSRPSTAEVDRALGFAGFVHFYLVDSPARIFELPILQAQLRRSSRPPFPHVVLELRTSSLADSDSLICNWNLAVSRPATHQTRGGNWTRGTDPARIAEVWRLFRAGQPTSDRARGYFNDPHLVPTLKHQQIRPNLHLLRTAPRRMPELLLRSPVGLRQCAGLHFFSDQDLRSARLLGPPCLPGAIYRYPGYSEDVVAGETRRRIEAYFRAPRRKQVPEFDFDAVRPVAEHLMRAPVVKG